MPGKSVPSCHASNIHGGGHGDPDMARGFGRFDSLKSRGFAHTDHPIIRDERLNEIVETR